MNRDIKASEIKKYLNLLTFLIIVLFLYRLFSGEYYDLTTIIFVLTPILVLFYGLIENNYLLIRDFSNSEKSVYGKVNVCTILLAPTLILLTNEIPRRLDSYQPLIIFYLIMLATLFVLMYFVGFFDDSSSLLLILLFSCAYTVTVTNEINEFFDYSEPTIIKTDVIDKIPKRSKWSYWTINVLGEHPKVKDNLVVGKGYIVSRDFFEKVEDNQKLCIYQYAGFLGAGYSTLHFCN